MRERKDGVKTRDRILTAACKVLSERGFRDATIKEISALAGTNTALVNYHFGDKETLYVETWRQAFLNSIQMHPPDGGVPSDAPPEERLRGRIRSIIERRLDPKCFEFSIVHKEMANPTGLLEEVMRQSIEPIRQALFDILKELLGSGATAEQVHLCEISIMSQCLHPSLCACSSHSHFKRFHPARKFDKKKIVDHIITFSLAGIRQIRRQINNKDIPLRRKQHE